MKKNILTIVITAIVTVLFLTFVAQLSIVVGSSMEPLLHDEDIVLMEKITKEYNRFDIIIARKNYMFIVKRIIGLPGETVQIIDNDIYINGEKIDDPIDIEMKDYGLAEEKITLKDDEYFVLGDNRNNSLDSRFEEIGLINKDDIKGRVIVSLFPFYTIEQTEEEHVE